MGFPHRMLLVILGLVISGLAHGADTDVRVMSFNIRYGTAQDGEDSWGNRREALLSSIRAFGPDLLGTQECLKEQAEWLIERLPEYAFIGVGRDDGGLRGEMCGIFHREDRFRADSSGHFWLSETPDSAGSRSWDSALPRIVSWARLREMSDTLRTVHFLDTHFDHVGVEARRRSAELLRSRAIEIAGGSPIVVTGDFNAPADETDGGPYGILTKDGRLIDTYRLLHSPAPDEGTFHGFRGTIDGPRIDWILVSPEFEVRAAEIMRGKHDGRWTSDHFPVTAVIRPLR